MTLQYIHGPYEHFCVEDPKRRSISKASVRDRFVHHMVHDLLTGFLDQKMIFHSLASRWGKGIYVGISELRRMIRQVSQNGRGSCYGLKIDIRRFFDTIDHAILKGLLWNSIRDEALFNLIEIIIDSFKIHSSQKRAVGLPLGNVTSQLFANLYLHELDVFIKHNLQEKFYLRYCDDFLILSQDEKHLSSQLPMIRNFLADRLKLQLHPQKIILCKLSQGIDFVGYALFEHHILVRTSTKRRETAFRKSPLRLSSRPSGS